MTFSPRLPASLLVSLALVAAPAGAHLNLDEAGTHLSRYGKVNIKEGPCGMSGSGRGTNVYTYTPGEVIKVGVSEFIGHPGYFRIAFDDDGDDSFVNPKSVKPINRPCMNDPLDHCGAEDFYNTPGVLLDNLDPHDYPSTPFGTPTPHSWDVTLPKVECDNCTLQVIQVMTDPPGIHAPYNPDGPAPDDIYYQCIDLVLKRPAGSGGDAGARPPAAGSSAPGKSGDSGGCALGRGGVPSGGGGLLAVLGLLGAVGVRRRK
jgi:hypothetical protein